MKVYHLYMSKLNPEANCLWQRPKKSVSNRDKIWYDNSPVGKDPLNNAMKTLSKNAGLSTVYKNHSIRATVVTNLDQKGFEARHIMATTGHKSEVSIKNYARRCPTQKRREMSDALANSMKKELQNMNESTSKKFKSAVQEENSTINTPTFNLEGAQLETIDESDINDLFGLDDKIVESQEVMDLVAQIENENNSLAQKADSPKTPKTPKTYNFSNISNIANINRLPFMPSMSFPHLNVTINYNFK